MIKNITAVSTLVLFILIHAWFAVAADQKLLEDITFETASEDEERITFKLNGVYIPKIFAMKGERPRVVFDFPDIRPARLLNNNINTNGKFVKRIRMGIHSGPKPKTRVVFDLQTDKEVEFKHDFDTKKNALIISVYHAGAEPDSRPDVQEGKNDIAPENLEQAEKTIPAQKPEATETLSEPEPETPEQEEKSTITSPPSAPVQTVVQPPDEKVEPAPQEPEAQQPEPKLSDTQPADQQEEEQIPVPAETSETVKSTGPPVLRSITFDNSTNRGEMVLFKINDFQPPTVFGIEKGLPRVVCDFIGAEAAPDVPNVIKTDGKYVHTIRIGRENTPKKVRVVLDLTSSKNYDLQQIFFKDDNLFAIIINSLNNTPATEELEKPLQ